MKLDRLKIVQLRLELALVDDVPGDGAADFHVDRLAGVVANPLGQNFVVIPAEEGRFLFLEDAIATDFAKLLRAYDAK